MGAYLRAARRAGVDEETFRRSTPYNVQAMITAAGEAALMTGWWVARFAVEREPRLSVLSHYLDGDRSGEADDGDALIASFGMMHGLAVEDLPEEGEG